MSPFAAVLAHPRLGVHVRNIGEPLSRSHASSMRFDLLNRHPLHSNDQRTHTSCIHARVQDGTQREQKSGNIHLHRAKRLRPCHFSSIIERQSKLEESPDMREPSSCPVFHVAGYQESCQLGC